MNESRIYDRRSALKLGVALAAPAIIGLPDMGRAQGRPLVRVLNAGGNLNQILQQLAVQEGLLDRYEVDAEFTNVSGTSAIVAGIVSGQYDICTFAGINSLFPAVEAGADLRVVAGATDRLQQAIYSKNPEVKTIKDLAGKTVGVGPMGALLHEAVVAILKKEGVDPKTVNFVNIGSSADIYKAVFAGTVDAGPSTTDNLDVYEEQGLHILEGGKLWQTLEDYTFQGAFSSERAIRDNREGLVRILAVYGTIYQMIALDPTSKDAFVQASVEAIGERGARGATSLWEFMHENKTLSAGLVISEDRIQRLQELNVELGVQQQVLPFDQVSDMSLAEDALKLIG